MSGSSARTLGTLFQRPSGTWTDPSPRNVMAESRLPLNGTGKAIADDTLKVTRLTFAEPILPRLCADTRILLPNEGELNTPDALPIFPPPLVDHSTSVRPWLSPN